MRIDWAGLSDRGRRRTSNEDSFLADGSLGLFVVADGMGGHAAGEVASRLAVDTVRRVLGETGARPEPRLTIERAITEANRAIVERTQEHEGLEGMGTTLVLALIDASSAWISHVGDSRAYRVRGGALQLLTRDHSWVNEQVRMGLLSQEEARRHPWRNVVTRALGSREQVEAEVGVEELVAGDRILLCSDGLNSMVKEDKILEAIDGAGNDLELACRRLIELANGSGGEDNITVLLLGVSPHTAAPKTP
jgi:protein phosphatase